VDARIWSLAWLALAAACDGGAAESRRDVEPPEARYPVTINTPRVLEGLPVGPLDVSGRPTVVACGTCHEPGEQREFPESAGEVGAPHAGLSIRHGELPCASCHAQSDRSELHLADGTDIPLTDALRLCAQCHGPQYRDYRHGAHGGMRGHWDLSRGPRERNHCVACHDPHAPAFGQFEPVPGPRDRFTGAAAPHGDAHD
jgi:hypothetical protein